MATIKIFDFNQKDDMYSVITETFVAKKCCEHMNIVRPIHCCFKEQNRLLVVMPENQRKPLPSISIFKHGLPVEMVAFVIMETLKALDWMHDKGERVHGNLVCSNVFSDEEANVKIEFPTWLNDPKLVIYSSLDRKNRRSEFSMVGILAYDLFNGKETSSNCSAAPAQKKLQQHELLEDFMNFCACRGAVTIKDLMSHRFFKEFCHLDQYKQDFKKLLE